MPLIFPPAGRLPGSTCARVGGGALGLLGHQAFTKALRSEGLGLLDQVADGTDGWVFH